MTREEFNVQVLPLSDSLYRVAFYLLESETDAMDAVQDLFVKLWKGRESLEEVKNLKAYCITMMKNLCYDIIRKASRIQSVEVPESLSAGSNAEKELMDKERLSRVMAAMEKLPKSQREVLKMYVFDELSYEEIAQKTGKSNLNLRVLISMARKNLKELL